MLENNKLFFSPTLVNIKLTALLLKLNDDETTISCVRYGNVMYSRGSVIPLFINQIRNGQPITITDPEMTRLMMSLDQAVELVLFAFENGISGDVFVQKAPAATIKMLAKTVSKVLGKPGHEIKIIGTLILEFLSLDSSNNFCIFSILWLFEGKNGETIRRF